MSKQIFNLRLPVFAAPMFLISGPEMVLAACKAGIIGATKALALELAKRAITVNCVAPGLIETDMTAGVPLADALKLIPARRLGQPDEVAAAVSFLIGPDAAYITRQVISVNGGLA